MLRSFLRPLALLAALSALFTQAFALDLSVPVGGDIQAAVDQVSEAGGGSVRLASGKHELSRSLLLRSHVRLAGEGPGSTVVEGGDFIVMKQAEEGLHEVTVEKLKVVGRPAKTSFGIVIEAYKTRHEGVTLRDIEVTGAGMGVHIKRADKVLIEASRIHANGSADQKKYYHNLYIRSCEDVRVLDCSLDRGSSGNGLNVSYCKKVVVERCSAVGNFFRGMRAAATEGFSVVGCTISENGDVGLIANQEQGRVTRAIDWRGNTVTHNAKGGLQALEGATGRVDGNTVADNGKFDVSLPAGFDKAED